MFTFETLFNANTTSFFICLLVTVVVIALWLVIRQNNKLIEESVRPYLSITASADSSGHTGQFVLKNHGKSVARITRFQYPDVLKENDTANDIYQNIRGMEIAPGQAVSLPYNANTFHDESIEFKLIYHSSATEKNYSEAFIFKTAQLNRMNTIEN